MSDEELRFPKLIDTLRRENAALRESVECYEKMMTKYVGLSEKIVKERDLERAQRLELQKKVDDTIEWQCRCGATDSKGRRDRQYLLDAIECHVRTSGLLTAENNELKTLLAASDVDSKVKKRFSRLKRKTKTA
jgi:hypothetical protein